MATSGNRGKDMLTYYGLMCTIKHCGYKRYENHRYCARHMNKIRVHGDAYQEPISIRDVNFIRRSVALLIAENAENPKWHEMMEVYRLRWQAGIVHIQSEFAKYHRGVPMIKPYVNGLVICNDIFNRISMEDCFKHYCAWQYLQEWNPRLFVSDNSFRHNLVKDLRAKARSMPASYINADGTFKHYSAPLFVQERTVVWDLFSSIFGIAGMQLYKQIERRTELARKYKRIITDAVKHIK